MVFVTDHSQPVNVDKYISMTLGELLSKLVAQHEKLDELLARGEFRSERYLRYRRDITEIQDAIKSMIDPPPASIYNRG
jgi:hypothetical protein